MTYHWHTGIRQSRGRWAGGPGSNDFRWSKVNLIVENIRNVSTMPPLPPSYFSQKKGNSLLGTFCDIFWGRLLQNPSILSEAKKWNSTGLQRHDSLFPLTLCPSYSAQSTLYSRWWLRGRSQHYLSSKHTAFLFSLRLHCSRLGGQASPGAQFYPPFWTILGWQVDDMCTEKANE